MHSCQTGYIVSHRVGLPRHDLIWLSLPLEPSVKEIVFERVAESHLRQRAFLERLVGNYEVMGMALAITLKGEDTIGFCF